MKPVIYFATDHAGFALKNELVVFVRDVLQYTVIDCGAETYDEGDDFTDYIAKAAQEVSDAPLHTSAIILGGSGQGEAMLANRFPHVRAAVFYGGDEEIVRLSRLHNDANILSLGARFLSVDAAKSAVKLWLHTEHVPLVKYDRRINEIELFGSMQKKGTSTPVLNMSVVPSLPAESFAQIAALLDTLEDTTESIQIDIVDGIFAPYTSWPFNQDDVLFSLERLSSYADFDIEIDCMCMHPEAYLDTFVSIGINRVVIHEGSTSEYEACINHAKKHGYKIGFAIKNTTPRSFLEPYIDFLDFVQVMGIEHIGTQGQPFDERTLETVALLRASYPELEIAVDGAVNTTTITRLRDAGANRFAPGSAITQAANPVVAYTELARQVGVVE